jgi:hypothetical protein
MKKPTADDLPSKYYIVMMKIYPMHNAKTEHIHRVYSSIAAANMEVRAVGAIYEGLHLRERIDKNDSVAWNYDSCDKSIQISIRKWELKGEEPTPTIKDNSMRGRMGSQSLRAKRQRVGEFDDGLERHGKQLEGLRGRVGECWLGKFQDCRRSK